MPPGEGDLQWAVRPIFQSDIAQVEEAGDVLKVGVAVADERLPFDVSRVRGGPEGAVTEPAADGRGGGAAGVVAGHATALVIRLMRDLSSRNRRASSSSDAPL